MITTFIVLSIANNAIGIQAKNKKTYDGPYKDKSLSIKELKKIIHNHKEWLKAYQPKYDTDETYGDKRRANLNQAELDFDGKDKKLQNTEPINLSYAEMKGVSLSRINLSHSNLSYAGMEGAHFSFVDLNHADLNHVKLTMTKLNDINLSHACLSGANLSNAILSKTDLNGANLRDAYLNWSDLSQVAGHISSFIGAKELSNIRVKTFAR